VTNDLRFYIDYCGMDNVLGVNMYDPIHEMGSLISSRDRVRELLDQGESFDVFYREDGSKINDKETMAEGLSSREAVNHFLNNASHFDEFIATWDHENNLNSVTVYENKYDGILGTILPSRGDEMIFEYGEK